MQENNQGKCRRYLGNSKLAGKICPDLLIYPTDFGETGTVGKLIMTVGALGAEL